MNSTSTDNVNTMDNITVTDAEIDQVKQKYEFYRQELEKLPFHERRAFLGLTSSLRPYTAREISRSSREPVNKVSVYMRRLIEKGYVVESEGSKPHLKKYCVVDKLLHVYCLMRRKTPLT